MMRTRWIGGALSAVLLISVAAFAFADDPTTDGGTVLNSESIAQGGEYRNFNFWRKLKLATAYYVNPTLAESAELLYIYPDEALRTADLNAMFDQAGYEGLAVAMKGQDGTFKVVPFSDAFPGLNAQSLDPSAAQRLKLELANLQWEIAAKTNDLLQGVEPKPIVSWGQQYREHR